jgi:hypothetical protein
MLCSLLIADAIPGGTNLSQRGPKRAFIQCLPYFFAVSAATGILWHFAFKLPWVSLGFIPFWLALIWIRRVSGPAFWRYLSDFDSRKPAALLRSILLETSVLGVGFYLASAFYPGFWPNRLLPIAAGLAWPGVRVVTSRLFSKTTASGEWFRLGATFVLFSSGLAIALLASGIRPTLPFAVVLLWSLVAVAIARLSWRVLLARLPSPEAEVARWVVVFIVTLWLMRGYATYELSGAGDAQWYGMMLADMVSQVRSGVFPVWMGQSATQFNGAIYPLRIAPGFHYLGALLDMLTFRSAGVFALQNLLLTLIALGSTFCCYFSLTTLAPRRRWVAVALATLFFSCPGVLGMTYKNDLLMSWVTLPWSVLAWFATVRSFQNGGRPSTMVLLGASLGLCWWGHSPIALWMTLVAGSLQIVRIVADLPTLPKFSPLAAGAVSFLAVAAYPLGSVLLYPPEKGLQVDAFQRATASSIAYFVRDVFPAILLPLTPGGHALGDLQLGYAIWAILFFCAWAAWRQANLPARACLGASVLLLLLLIPVPRLNAALWAGIPGFVRNATSNWAMNRLYLVIAGAVIFGAGAIAAQGFFETRRRRLAFGTIIVLGCAWSLAEAAKFHRAPYDRPPIPINSDDMARPENAVITRFAYFIFPHPPDSFTHGVTDPEMESRLLTADAQGENISNYTAAKGEARVVASGTFVPTQPGTAIFQLLNRHLQIEPGRRYLLDFEFPELADTHGILELQGTGFYREYGLPEFGGARSFGAGGKHNSLMPVWTTLSTPVDLTLRFYPENTSLTADPIRVRLLEYDREALPVMLKSLIPYRARVISPQAGWLETPRMHQLGYIGKANGRAAQVRRSADGLALVAVPAGESEVELLFRPAIGLQLLFWTSLTAIALATMAALFAAATLSRQFSS